MAETAPLRVQLIAKTEFLAPADVPWTTDAEGGQALVEFAGRACYQSWSKPNPRTATNAGYLRHIIDVGHLSVLEHASVSLLHHRDLPLLHPRADPAPALLLLAAVPALRPRARRRRWSMPPGIEDDPELQRDVRRGGRRQPRGLHRTAGQAGSQVRRRAQRRRCAASRPGRRPARCCPTPPRPASWSPATTGPGGTSSRCGPASTPTWRSAGWPSSACVSSSTSPRRSSPTSRSPTLADGTEVATSPAGDGSLNPTG